MTARRKKPHTPAAPAQQPAAAEAPIPATAPPTGDHVPVTSAGQPTEAESRPVEAEGGPRRQWQPDPLPFMAVTLGSGQNSPKMTLFRSNRLNQLAIRFDEKPEEQHRLRLRADGWRWREDEGVWTKQMDRERRATSQMEAERLFTEIGEAIRAERGLTGRTDVGG